MNENNLTTQLITLISPMVNPLGYEIVHLELVNTRQKSLRIFIDRLNGQDGKGISIEDCVAVTRALDEPLDQIPEIEKIFKGHYELEVSSPGVDRPLRTAKDFERFAGQEIRVHVYRPLSAEELANPEYQKKNPKQKNFVGTLKGFQNDRVVLNVGNTAQEGSKKKRAAKSGKKEAAASSTNSADEVSIPLPLIAKANIEPKFDLAEREQDHERI